ncbi:MAG: phosphoribosylformylglycinamidine synthase subunit PurQ [Alphaproteobacteria bacterium]|nr:phosphoribosylformylglycinamidine synthase subunit PurQ [Alphaproteobacteria bacterium]
MKCAILVFPGLNRDRDMVAALVHLTGHRPQLIWHTETKIPPVDLLIIPGGFSYGDYLRPGAIAARSPILEEVKKHSAAGRLVMGICNGFQILTEAKLLPGTLMRNASLKFVCRKVQLEAVNTNTAFTGAFLPRQPFSCPVAHHDGNYFADSPTLANLHEGDQIAFRYAGDTNPNGSVDNIAGILNRQKNVLGLMPHPENLVEPAHGGTDGARLFHSILEALA